MNLRHRQLMSKHQFNMKRKCFYMGCIDVWCYSVQVLIISIWKKLGAPVEVKTYGVQASKEKKRAYTGYKDVVRDKR